MKFVLKDITNFTSRVLSDGKHLQQKKTISLIGTLKINKYLNTESINMIIEDMK